MSTEHKHIGFPCSVPQVNINANDLVTLTSPELSIPYSFPFENPNRNVQDVVFTNDEHSHFALRMFDQKN